MTIIKIEKRKNILEVTNNENKIYKIDFSTGDIIGIRGKILKTTPFSHAIVSTSIEHFYLWQNFFDTGTFNRRGTMSRENIKSSEKFIPYLDLIDRAHCYCMLPPEIPKGFIQYCKSNKYNLSLHTYRNFLITNAIEKSNYCKKDKLRLNNLCKYFNIYDRNDMIVINSILDLCNNKQHKDIYFQILNNSLKNFDMKIQPLDLLLLMVEYGFEYALVNAGCYENLKLYQQIKENKIIEKIPEQQHKISELEGIEHEKYCIVIPKNIQDLKNEGEQQNNCVGYYYNENIANGRDLIYFIRFKDNPKKSYVTCRYHIFDNKTMEQKARNNDNTSTEIKNFIKDIVDPAIRKIFCKIYNC